jgi:hypothetical protein
VVEVIGSYPGPGECAPHYAEARGARFRNKTNSSSVTVSDKALPAERESERNIALSVCSIGTR